MLKWGLWGVYFALCAIRVREMHRVLAYLVIRLLGFNDLRFIAAGIKDRLGILTKDHFLLYEPPRGKTNNVVSEKV